MIKRGQVGWEIRWSWLPLVVLALVAALVGAALSNAVENDTVDRWELVWCSLAYVGMVIHFRGFREAARDRAAAKLVQNGRLRVARGRVREELGRMVKQGGFLLVGCIVANLPGVPGRSFPSLATRVVFIGAELLMIYLSVAAQYDDAKLLEGT